MLSRESCNPLRNALFRISIDSFHIMSSTKGENLERFVMAQERCYDSVLKELRNGQKRSHWIWFVFPQVAELGFSENSIYYGIKSVEEAKAYMLHPILGPRLLECSNLLLRCENKSIGEILGYPDDAKLRSSMSLYYHACDEEVDSGSRQVFQKVLDKYYQGSFDERTLEVMNEWKKKIKSP